MVRPYLVTIGSECALTSDFCLLGDVNLLVRVSSPEFDELFLSLSVVFLTISCGVYRIGLFGVSLADTLLAVTSFRGSTFWVLCVGIVDSADSCSDCFLSLNVLIWSRCTFLLRLVAIHF